MEIKVVTGANLGDEGKGLVSYCLAKEATEKNHKVLTVLYNGGVQRGHTAGGKVFHCLGTGALVGSDTFYHEKFLLDPIALFLTQETPIIDPRCRVVLPCDVVRNRKKELARGGAKHGSCGLGIFEASKRNATQEFSLYAAEMANAWNVYPKVKAILEQYDCGEDELYNLDNWMRAIGWVVSNCKIATFDEVATNYDTIIFEGGQGLLLDQSLINFTKHLTPSSVGHYNIAELIRTMNAQTDVYYVSRTYMTRHGVGEMEAECAKEDINPLIVDKTNQRNDWQDDLRFGYINERTLYNRVQRDFQHYHNANAHMVFTQMNYTNGRIAIGKNEFAEIQKPSFITNIHGSWKEDTMSKIEI